LAVTHEDDGTVVHVGESTNAWLEKTSTRLHFIEISTLSNFQWYQQTAADRISESVTNVAAQYSSQQDKAKSCANAKSKVNRVEMFAKSSTKFKQQSKTVFAKPKNTIVGIVFTISNHCAIHTTNSRRSTWITASVVEILRRLKLNNGQRLIVQKRSPGGAASTSWQIKRKKTRNKSNKECKKEISMKVAQALTKLATQGPLFATKTSIMDANKYRKLACSNVLYFKMG
jgi:hypothetical protein